MDWWLKIKKTWAALFIRVKLRKSRVTRGQVGLVAEHPNNVSDGLLKLRDDVQMCGSKDVEVMWNMLGLSLQLEQMEATRVSNEAKFPKSSCKQKSILKGFVLQYP
ncbi:hypothetical protein Fmac_013160 [Flemingia macrophylla]|uniref:Uncharacterized protein n=1 Tax=Flemingia macrophylla TaxID=520843 RepID=A0ABD1MSC7_9FABA